MSVDILISHEIHDYYTSHYRVKHHAIDEPIHFVAECSINPDTTMTDAYYFVNLFFSVGQYGNREHLIGLYFGDSELSKEDLDVEIRSRILDQLEEGILDLVGQYLKKESLMEEWLDNNEENDD